MTRAMMSVALPAVNGTTNVICLLGQACACAEKDALKAIAPMRAETLKLMTLFDFFMIVS
jgi:hypothetical protein